MLKYYVCISPKDVEVAQRVFRIIKEYQNKQCPGTSFYDIKIVTDLNEVGVDTIKYATALMPLTTTNLQKNKEIEQRVWEECVKRNLFYSGRIHVQVWGATRGK